MKVYEITWHGGEQDWFCANSSEEAKKICANTTGEDPSYIPEPRELTDEEAKSSLLIDINEYYEEIPEGEEEENFCGGYRITMSMYDAVQKEPGPGPLASSEF
jgi:hypothetical protein